MTNQNYEMQNELNYTDTDAVLEQLAQKQEYLDYIDADMEAFYSIKIDAIPIE